MEFIWCNSGSALIVPMEIAMLTSLLCGPSYFIIKHNKPLQVWTLVSISDLPNSSCDEIVHFVISLFAYTICSFLSNTIITMPYFAIAV